MPNTSHVSRSRLYRKPWAWNLKRHMRHLRLHRRLHRPTRRIRYLPHHRHQSVHTAWNPRHFRPVHMALTARIRATRRPDKRQMRNPRTIHMRPIVLLIPPKGHHCICKPPNHRSRSILRTTIRRLPRLGTSTRSRTPPQQQDRLMLRTATRPIRRVMLSLLHPRAVLVDQFTSLRSAIQPR